MVEDLKNVGELFGVSQEQVTKNAKEFDDAVKNSKTVVDLIEKLNLMGAGGVALKAFALGRLVEKNEITSYVKEHAGDLTDAINKVRELQEQKKPDYFG